jgi:hypothetical protein
VSATTRYVVVGTSPFADTSVAVGPFGSLGKALAASREVEHLGYVTEICPLHSVADLAPLSGAEDGD